VQVEFVTSAARPEQFPAGEAPEVAFLGRSNVGKSSLINRLTGVPGLAQTSSTPGRTQTINFFRVDRALSLADLPGYGYAKVPLGLRDSWKELIESYLLQRTNLRLSLILLDGRRGWMEKDLELKQWLEFHNRPFAVAATKWDKLNQKEQHHGAQAIRRHLPPESDFVPFSALTGRGARELWQTIWNIKKL
jgi:GTP-binding protein